MSDMWEFLLKPVMIAAGPFILVNIIYVFVRLNQYKQ